MIIYVVFKFPLDRKLLPLTVYVDDSIIYGDDVIARETEKETCIRI